MPYRTRLTSNRQELVVAAPNPTRWPLPTLLTLGLGLVVGLGWQAGNEAFWYYLGMIFGFVIVVDAIRSVKSSRRWWLATAFALVSIAGLAGGIKWFAPLPGALLLPLLPIWAYAFVRTGTTLNRAECSVRTWWGIWLPLLSDQRSMGTPEQVKLEPIHDESSYIVTLDQGSDGDPDDDRRLLSADDYEQARGIAEDIARYYRVGLLDHGGPGIVFRSAAQLEEQLVSDRR